MIPRGRGLSASRKTPLHLVFSPPPHWPLGYPNLRFSCVWPVIKNNASAVQEEMTSGSGDFF